MPSTRTNAALAVLLMTACASPEEVFIGTYAGTYMCSGPRTVEAPFSAGPTPQTIEIDRNLAGDLRMTGAECPILLTLASPRHASIERSGCDTHLDSGAEAVATYRLGTLTLTEPEIEYALSVDVWLSDDSIVRMTCTFDGVRIE